MQNCIRQRLTERCIAPEEQQQLGTARPVHGHQTVRVGIQSA